MREFVVSSILITPNLTEDISGSLHLGSALAESLGLGAV